MAFNIDCDLLGYEFRALNTGVGKQTGKPWASLMLENVKNSRQVDVRLPYELVEDFRKCGIKRGDLVSVRVSAVAGKDYSFITAHDIPTLYNDAIVGGDF